MNTFFIVSAIILAAAALYDGLSTAYFLKRGATEQNPLFGKKPSKWRVFGEGSALIAVEIGACYALGHFFPALQGYLTAFFLGQSALHSYFAYKNFQIKA